MNRLALLVATTATALIVPGAADAAASKATTINAAVTTGVLTYTSAAGTVDNVTVGQSFGGVTISEPTSPENSPVGAGCGIISATSAYCTGATSASVQTLDLDDTIVNWSWLPATLDAGGGTDTISGGVAAETIRGGDGNDTIKAGKGADTVDAGPGDDRVDVQDGVVDVVDCGAGSDTIVADADDVLVNCDLPAAAGTLGTGTRGGGATASPDGQSTGGPLDAPKLLAAATLVGPIIAAVSHGAEVKVGENDRAPFVLACSAEESKACSGVVFIDPITRKARGKKSKRATQSVSAFMARRGRYGSSPFKVKPGSEDEVDVELSAIALKALGRKSRGRQARAARRGRRVRAVVTIAPKNARAQRVTIVLKG